MGRILIVGGDGFIGKHLKLKFKEEGANYFAPTISEMDIMDDKLKNLRDIDLVYNFAVVLEGDSDEKEMRKCNVEGVRNLLELCRLNNATFIFTSSCAVYGSPDNNPIDEKHRTNPVNKYGRSKLEAEKLCEKYRKEYGVKVFVLRIFNLIGENQKESFLLPKILGQLEEGKVRVRNLHSSRDFLDVKDLIDLFSIIAHNRDLSGSVYNVGRGEVHSVDDMLKELKKHVFFEISSDESYGGVRNIYADTKKIIDEIGWKPNRSFAETIERIHRNFKENQESR